MSPPFFISLGALLVLIWTFHDFAVLRLALRAAPGSVVRLTLSSRVSLHYQAADGHAEHAPAHDGRSLDDTSAGEPAGAATFDHFFRSTYRDVHKIVARKFRGMALDVDAALQHAYLALSMRWSDDSTGGFDGRRQFVIRAAQNKLLDEIRQTGRTAHTHREYASDPTSPSLRDDSLSAAIQRRVLRDAQRATLMRHLEETAGETARLIVWLHFATDSSTAEIAEWAGCSRRTVNRHVHEACTALQARFESDYPGLKALFRAGLRKRRGSRACQGSATDEEAGQ
ncbi:sigma-70 family RNA polymerase sigma factor [Spirillospora sp. NPDC047418]|jgi:RNA polymerase sigma factor (sigma-70 family)